MEWLELGNRVVRRALVLRGVSSEVVRLRGADVHYYRAEGRGDGPPLLLVHGLGSSANAFFRTLRPLTRTFRAVYALDLPGNGFSPVPAAGPLPLREFVEVLRDFRREVIRERVFLVGNSLGGGMALNFAFQEPTALVALGLVSPAGARVSDERFAQLLQSFHVTDRREARALAHKLFAKAPLGLLLFADELRKMVSTETVRAIVKEASPADLVSPAELAKLDMPTLLLWGTHEKLLPAEGLAFFREHLPKHAEVHEVDGFGHMPQMEHPEDFVERFRHFAHRKGLATPR